MRQPERGSQRGHPFGDTFMPKRKPQDRSESLQSREAFEIFYALTTEQLTALAKLGDTRPANQPVAIGGGPAGTGRA